MKPRRIVLLMVVGLFVLTLPSWAEVERVS
jgi:hypothetical protein